MTGADPGFGVNDSTQSDVDAVYREAVQFIHLAEEIKMAPEKLRNLHDRLRSACSELSDSVDFLRHQANELQGIVRKNNVDR